MRSYYETHKDLLELIVQREQLWEEMLEFEKKASDPNRFFNDRGGKLLREEKARKKLMKELPRIEEDARERIEDWEKQNGKKFQIEGVPFAEYVEKQWKNFHEQKEQEKKARLQNKAKQMEEEMIFGSKPTCNTPAKRRIANTPGRTPLKARKTPNMNHSMRRRSLRRARKVLQESIQRGKGGVTAKGAQPEGAGQADMFSQTTVSSGASGANMSVATTGSYQEFAKGLSQTARPNCRSSVAPSISCSPLKRW